MTPLSPAAGTNELVRLLVIQPAVPAYRAPFFESLFPRLLDRGIASTVVTGGYSLSDRGDETKNTWIRSVPDRLHGRAGGVRWRRWNNTEERPDLIIVEQAVKNLETYPLLARKSLGGPRVAMWGHGRSYSTPQGPALSAAKQWLTRRSDWFFAYTAAGADHVISQGFPATRISVLNNTIDSDSLRNDLDAVSDDDVGAFTRRHGLTPNRTALFLGGVDRAKGIDFLLESAQHASKALPGFVLLVGGAGAQLDDVQAAERAGAPVRALGRLDGPEKALALRSADVLAIPEWIGLVAVDSLVAGRPIVSTWHPSHSPEHEYLEPGRTAEFVQHDPISYAQGLVNLLTNPGKLQTMQTLCVAESANYSLDHMVDAFVEGVLAWQRLVEPRRWT